MLVGSYTNSVDSKGRVFLPAKFRSFLGDTVIVAKGAGNCLVVYTEAMFAQFIERLRKNGQTEAQKHIRFLSVSAANLEPDVQGRIMLPKELREYAQLDKEVLFIGMVDTVEIWNKDNINNAVEGESSDLIEKYLIENGF